LPRPCRSFHSTSSDEFVVVKQRRLEIADQAGKEPCLEAAKMAPTFGTGFFSVEQSVRSQLALNP